MIIVVDYGMGNLRSVSKALEHLGAKVKVSSSPANIKKASKLVLPGVGAFGDAVKELKNRKLFQPIQDFIGRKRPFLGICLGLQLLFLASEESPKTKGLGIFEGSVNRFRSKDIKVPHMGWNSVSLCSKHPWLKGVPNHSYFYFVHSYYAAPSDRKITVGETTCGDETFAAVIGGDNLLATQFHPEKSQKLGLQILKNFIAS